MGERTCVICDAQLSGRQRKYCGRRCSIKANDIRSRQHPEFAVRRKQYQRSWAERVGVNSTSICPTKPCEHCGRLGVGYTARFCSRSCASVALHPTPGPSKCRECGAAVPHARKFCSMKCVGLARRSPLSRSVQLQDWPTVVDLLLANTTTAGDCRRWGGRLKVGKNGGGGYGVLSVGKQQQFQAHRLMAQAARGGADLGHMPVHHTCGNSWCINPDHLQVVTPHENTAEMLERTHYLARIHALESALAAVAPQHPILRT